MRIFRFFTLSTTLLTFSLFLPSTSLARESAEPELRFPIEVHGHRGARALRPENTMAAFRHAYALGVDVIELDVAVTRDNKLIISHDLYLNPENCLELTGQRLRQPRPALRSLTLAELQRFDCGSLKNPSFSMQVPVPGEKMPSFDEFLDWFASISREGRGANLRMNVEAKIDADQPELSVAPEHFVELLLKAVDRRRLRGRLILQSFDPRILLAARRIAPDLVLSALNNHPLRDAAQYVNQFHPQYYSPSIGWLGALTSRSTIHAMHLGHVRVVPYTANHPHEWDRLIRNGVNGIITDDPAALIQYLQQKGLR